MQLSKNKKYQFLFFFILSIYIIFNGGNSNIAIQINFILISLLFLYCLKDKNYYLHFKIFCSKNKISIFFFISFILFLVFQIVPLPIEYLKLFSHVKYEYISKLSNNGLYSSISLSPSNSIFQIFNFISLLILIFILKMIFYTDRHKNRLFLFLSFVGFISAFFGIVIYLIGSPDFLIFKNTYYPNSATGFFINRTVFAIFLLFCLIASLEFLKNLDESKYKKKNNSFFLKIYIRLFIIFITIGIITSFSRIGNFLLLFTALAYLIYEFFYSKSNNKSFRNIILLIIFFDIIILGFYFGSSELFNRFLFLKEDISEISSTEVNLSRFQIAKFAVNQLYHFKFFGYGAGSFETMFQIMFENLDNKYANHAHSDIIEFIGEFGFIGFALLVISLSNFIFKKTTYHFTNLIIFSFLIILLVFDFSLHTPLIQIFFIIFLTLNKKIIQ